MEVQNGGTTAEKIGEGLPLAEGKNEGSKAAEDEEGAKAAGKERSVKAAWKKIAGIIVCPQDAWKERGVRDELKKPIGIIFALMLAFVSVIAAAVRKLAGNVFGVELDSLLHDCVVWLTNRYRWFPEPKIEVQDTV